MRIVIDMQGAQSSGNWNRGIGRYTTALALAMVRNSREHEVFLALNGAFPASIERIRANFEGLLPQKNILVWSALPPMAYREQENQWRRQSGELVREAFFASLNPDFVIVSSLFEGLGDDAVTSVTHFSDKYLAAVILYDLIPFIHRQPYLNNPEVESWYLEKIEYLRHADLWLAISESSRQEGVEHLALTSERCINISTDADAQFRPMSVLIETERLLRKQYGLTRNFVMYTGGIDHRKNIEGLIRAYARLSPQLRATHQLTIVCSVQEDARCRLLALAASEGMNADEVIMTGFVSEEDLIALYNLCAVFVFPSWHEGFGLPALEAMRCGAPVIAANTSSLPEVIGLKDALFDPCSDEAIKNAIERVLTDDLFRESLVAHGIEQSKKFSWDETARRAIDAMNQMVIARDVQSATHVHVAPRIRPRLAYISPLPPERSGISDYSAELLPALAQHYEIEVVVAQDSVTDAWIKANCPIRSVQWFVENSDRFDRVLYHFGNSAFHKHMFGLLETIPGVLVLHDFYLSGVLHYMDFTGYWPGCFADCLYLSHGYAGLSDLSRVEDMAEVIWKYPCSRQVIENSIGTIVHSENSIRLAKKWYGFASLDFSVIPHMRVSASTDQSRIARKALGIGEKDFIVCSFGMLGPTKLNHRLLEAWLNTNFEKSDDCHLIFVGENNSGDYGSELLSIIKRHPKGYSVKITGWADSDKFRNYLAAADVGVQLRTLSRGETSGTVLDCMNYGLATIVNANGSMADLADDAVWKLPDDFDDQALIHALETLWRDRDRRERIGIKAKSIILKKHDPLQCAEQYKIAIENCYKNNPPTLKNLLKSIGTLSKAPVPDGELISLADAIASTFSPVRSHRTLFVDISELVQRDARTGIQKVVRSILKHWLLNPPVGWRVEPVYATDAKPYRHASEFTSNFLGIPRAKPIDEPTEFLPGDIFFALDLQPQVQVAKADFYQHLRQQGVIVKFLVYDLLCIDQPQHFLPGAADGFSKWLQVVVESDGAICISRSVAEEFRDWMGSTAHKRLRPFQLDSNPLGADISSAETVGQLPVEAQGVMKYVKQRMSFLMVGTLEPRKAHPQVIDAFEKLWRTGLDINLVIAGKQGWLTESLAERLRTHQELGRRLFWLEGISDEYLEKIYVSSTCLVAASYGEGFGLPLIEAAQHALPIIARDIPVFREVAGEHAYYFSGTTDVTLVDSIIAWLLLYENNQHPLSVRMKWHTWEESAANLLKKVLLPSSFISQRCNMIGDHSQIA